MEQGTKNKLRNAGAMLAAIGTNVACGYFGVRIGELASVRFAPGNEFVLQNAGLIGMGAGVAVGHVAAVKVYDLLADHGDQELEVVFNGAATTVKASDLLALLKENAELKAITKKNEAMMVKIGEAVVELRELSVALGAESRTLIEEIRSHAATYAGMSPFDLPAGVSVDSEGVTFQLPGGKQRRRSFADLKAEVTSAVTAGGEPGAQLVQPETSGDTWVAEPAGPLRSTHAGGSWYRVYDANERQIGAAMRKEAAEKFVKEFNERPARSRTESPLTNGQAVGA